MSELHFRIAVGTAATLFVIFVLSLKFCGGIELPPKPPKPKLSERNAQDVARSLDTNQRVYQQHILRDAAAYGVDPPPTIESMGMRMRYRADRKRRVLKPGDTVTASGLRIGLSIRDPAIKNKATLMLTITNTTDRPLAYRVDTNLPRGESRCGRKKSPRHNALAIAAKGREVRSECMYRAGSTVAVTAIETVELTDLGYYYVSNLRPTMLQISTRTSQGHRGHDGEPKCDQVLPAEVKRALERGSIRWYDLVDYYARHRCQSYRFPSNYRAFTTDGEYPLPLSAR